MRRTLRHRPAVLVAVLIAVWAMAACAGGSPSAAPSNRTISPSAGPSPLSPAPTGAETLPPPTGVPVSPNPRHSPKPPPSGTGIAGITLIHGRCPVMTERPCPTMPVPAHLSITDDATGSVVAKVDSGADGRFSLATQPGRYTLHPSGVPGALPRSLTAKSVTVESGHHTTVTLTFFSTVQ